jgi:nucleoredoxin
LFCYLQFLGIYFSAHWCPPCRGFTPKLVEYYNHRKAQGKDDFEVIFASSDRDQASFNEYYGEMPWLALPLGDPRNNKLSARYEVEGLPTFVIVDPDGNVVNKSARGCITSDPSGSRFPYYPEPVEDLSEGVESFGVDINAKPALLVLMENSDDSDQADAKQSLLGFGESLAKAKASSPEGPDMIFFYAFKPSQMATRVRELCKLPRVEAAEDPTMIILNIPDSGGYYQSADTDVNVETIGKFIAAFNAGTLQRKQLGA